MVKKYLPNKSLQRINIFLIFLVILFLFSLFSQEIYAATCDLTKTVKVGGVCVPKSSTTGLSDKSVYDLLESVFKWLLSIIGILAMLGFAVSGIMYMTSYGDEKKVETAKNMMTYSVIGMAVALVGYAVVYTVNQIIKP